MVFLGRDPDMGRDVAIKVLRDDSALASGERDEIARRFDREAQAGGGLTHPNIVAHYERGQTGKWKYIVMEFVEGRSLNDLMSREPRLTTGEMFSILRQMASALDYAHGRGVIHRDIKPANVLVQAQGTIKIADFGVAKCSAPGAATSSSMVIGSPHYMAPEQIEARPVAAGTDQWALAVTAYELLTGKKPFESESMAALFQQILAATPPDPRELDPSLPAAVKDVFAKALDKSPQGRFETCTAFVDCLSGAMSTPAEAPRASRRRVSVRVKPGFLWAAGLAVILLLGAAAAWLIITRVGTGRTAAQPESARVFRPGELRVNQRDHLPYIWIAPGSFRMGCPAGDAHCSPNEFQHEVTLSKGYWFGRTEVTTGAFKRFAVVAGARLPAAPDFNPAWANDELPVTNVSWDDAARYCRWAQGRLPTEAEWEYAARAGSPEASYGPLNDIAWSTANSDLRAHEVARKRPNALGLFDTLGNVWEWTADRYDEEYYQRSAPRDPQGPDAGDFRVLRGGSWIRDPSEIRVSLRYPLLPGNPDQGIGFRCVADQLP